MRWSKKAFDAQGLTQFPTGEHLGALTPKLRIRVTSVGRWDNIGEVLTEMGVAFEAFDNQYDCDILFANCGTPDFVDGTQIRSFVENGGCLYASDLQASTVLAAFPELFRENIIIPAGTVDSMVEDLELAEIIGSSVNVQFDTFGRVLESTEAFTILRHPLGMSIMIEAPVGNGAVFFTSFHNHAQASQKERELLQLLVLKQIGRKTKTSVTNAGRSLGLRLGKR